MTSFGAESHSAPPWPAQASPRPSLVSGSRVRVAVSESLSPSPVSGTRRPGPPGAAERPLSSPCARSRVPAAPRGRLACPRCVAGELGLLSSRPLSLHPVSACRSASMNLKEAVRAARRPQPAPSSRLSRGSLRRFRRSGAACPGLPFQPAAALRSGSGTFGAGSFPRARAWAASHGVWYGPL